MEYNKVIPQVLDENRWLFLQQPVAVYFLMEEQAKAYREEEEDLFVYILLNVNQLLIN